MVKGRNGHSVLNPCFLFAFLNLGNRSSILSDLNAGVTLLCDRYAFSGIAFTLAKGLPFEWCLYPDIGLPAPDLILFFDVSPEVAKQRGGYGEERYEKEEMQKKVRTAFKRIATTAQGKDDGKWVEVDAGRDIYQVGEDVWREVEEILAGDPRQVHKLWMERLESKGTSS